MLWKAVKPYVYAAGLVALIASHGLAYHFGGKDGELEIARTHAAQVEAQLKAVQEDLKTSAEASARLGKKLDGLPTSTTIERVIRENPSPCVVPDAVDRQLRQDIGRINKELSG